MLAWLKPLAPHLRRIFLVHGEPEQSATLAERIQEEYGIAVAMPLPGESFVLE
jgi:predicted metal-dependent RNase